MKKYLLGLMAIAFAVSLVAFTTPTTPKKSSGVFTDYYFSFVGSNGEEADETKWNELTALQYAQANCPSTLRGCALKTTSIQQIGGVNRPTEVQVSGSGTDISPNTTTIVTQVKNRVSSY